MQIGGKKVAQSINTAGFLGVYTGHKPGVFSVSYNVRHSTTKDHKKEVIENLMRNFDTDYQPLE